MVRDRAGQQRRPRATCSHGCAVFASDTKAGRLGGSETSTYMSQFLQTQPPNPGEAPDAVASFPLRLLHENHWAPNPSGLVLPDSDPRLLK